MRENFIIGAVITYSHYGVQKTARIIRVSNDILFLDNKRWIFKTSVINQEVE